MCIEIIHFNFEYLQNNGTTLLYIHLFWLEEKINF